MSVAGSPTGAIRQQSGPRQWRRRAARSTRSAVTRWGSRDRRRRSRRVTGGGGDRVAPGGRPAVQSTPVMGTAPRHVWVDGRVVEATEPVLTAFDRGFQLGDGVFETLRARGGRPTELDEHLDRLRRSATGLDIELEDRTGARIADGIAALLAAERLDGPGGDASIRITVSRGAIAARGLLPLEHATPTIVIQAWPVPPPPEDHIRRGLHLVTSSVRRDPSNPLSSLKTTSRADYVFARLEARRAGADDALFLTSDGHLSEATSANVFLVRRGDEGEVALA